MLEDMLEDMLLDVAEDLEAARVELQATAGSVVGSDRKETGSPAVLVSEVPGESAGESGEPTPTKKQLTVTVAERETGNTLQLLLASADKADLLMEGEPSQVFKLLLAVAASGSQGQVVGYSELATGSPGLDKTTTRALRKQISNLNKQLSDWGHPPDGERWVQNKKTKGYFLNESVTWKLSKQLQSELLPARSVFSLSAGDSIGETPCPDGPSLPARRKGKPPVDTEHDD